jgi:hypothetical protein
MSIEAWFFLGVAWAVILSMTGYSFYKMLTSERDLTAGDTDSASPLPEAGGAWNQSPRTTTGDGIVSGPQVTGHTDAPSNP